MLIQPILYNMSAFDASHEQKFTFYVSGGDQVVANTLTIKTNDSDPVIVYSERQNTYRLEHTLPADTLTNGTYYQAVITTYNANDESSVESDPIQFYCYTQPTFNFISLPSSNILSSSVYTFQVKYEQDENEPLSQYNFSLYDMYNNLVATSGAVYTGVTTVPLIVEYQFDGFINGQSYVLVATGQTSEGTKLITSSVTLSVSYEVPSSFSPMFLTNNCEGGYIVIQSNLIIIDGAYSQSGTPTYIDNSAVSLLQDGESVTWDSNYILPDNYSVVVWGRNFINGENILQFTNDNGDLVIVKYCEDNGSCWFETYIYMYDDINQYVAYECMSNVLDNISSSTNIAFILRHVNGLYDIWCNINE